MCEYAWTPFNDDGTVKAELIEDIVTPPKVGNDTGKYSKLINRGEPVNFMGRGA